MAVYYAKKAVQFGEGSLQFQNTLGFALELQARSIGDKLRKQATLSEAERLFDAGLRKDPKSAYDYLGKAFVLRQLISNETDSERRINLEATALSLLEEANEATNGSPILAGELAARQDSLGDPEEALATLSAALRRNSTNNKLRNLWIRIATDQRDYAGALRMAQEGAIQDPSDWRMHRAIARTQRILNAPLESVKGTMKRQ